MTALDGLTDAFCPHLVRRVSAYFIVGFHPNQIPCPGSELDPPWPMEMDLGQGKLLVCRISRFFTYQRATQLLEMGRVMAGIVSRFRLVANALTPINQFPPEILCEVFFHLRPVIKRGSKEPGSTRQPFGDLLAVTHNCQRWRVSAIAAPYLWSQLIATEPHKNFKDMIRLFISRSGELPLDADLRYQLAVVAPYTNHLRTLSCKGRTIDDFSHLCNRSAPFLETLHILPHYSDSANIPLPTLFNRYSPFLRELVVDGYNPLPNNHFRGLSSFYLRF